MILKVPYLLNLLLVFSFDLHDLTAVGILVRRDIPPAEFGFVFRYASSGTILIDCSHDEAGVITASGRKYDSGEMKGTVIESQVRSRWWDRS